MLLKEVNQGDIAEKNRLLLAYFESVKDGVSGKRVVYDSLNLEKTLYKKGFELLEQVRLNEWLEDEEDGWFNGYYDNDSLPLDNVKKKDMTFSGQVFSIMSNAATNDQVKKVVKSADKYLYQAEIGGYRLNTDFQEVKTNMGRLFGFAYGHKENGAMFSHMAMMYANALYQRGFVKEGYKVLDTIYQHSIDLPSAKMYPGIPEYFDPKGRGMYQYLTGSASWLILTLVTEVFGIKGD
jgi:cellobiose phosphorylase